MAENDYKKLYYELSAEVAKATECLSRAVRLAQEAYENANAASAATEQTGENSNQNEDQRD